MKNLTTERLSLRRWREHDADFVYDLYSRWEVQQFIGRSPRVMESRSEAEERIAIWRAMDHPLYGFWAVDVTETGETIGTILLKLIPASGDVLPLQPSADTEIGWHFHPGHWGHGFASEAASAVLRHAFAGGLQRVVAVTHPENLASQKVCTRIGLTHLGQTDAYYNATCELFAKTATDYGLVG